MAEIFSFEASVARVESAVRRFAQMKVGETAQESRRQILAQN